MNYCVVGLSYITDDVGTKVALSLRDQDGKRKTMLVPYVPYFFVSENDSALLKSIIRLNNLDNLVLDKSYGFKSVDGKKLIKISVKFPYAVSMISKSVVDSGYPISMHESNILFPYRFIIDKQITTGIDENLNSVTVESRHRTVFVDIEVSSNGDPKKNLFPVIVIGIFDSKTKQYHSIFTGRDFPIDLNVLNTEPKEVNRYPCKNEEELFEKFASVWLSICPDVVVTFSPFDMEYLVSRMGTLNIDYKFLSPIFEVKENPVRIGLVEIVDFAETYRKVFGEPVWNTLDYISNHELGYGKLKIGPVADEWKKDYKKVVEYNLRDVELLKDIEDEIGLLSNYLLMIWSYTGLLLSDCIKTTRLGDILHLRHVNGRYIFKTTSDVKGVPYKGALVICKHPDLYHNILVLDWNELYPSIMETFHISGDTLDMFGDINLGDNMIFTSSRIGWTNEIIIPFRVKRQEIKKLSKSTDDPKLKRKYKMLSAAIKVIVNAQYGLYGQKTATYTSRFYDPRVAGAITKMGREFLELADSFLFSLGYTLVYGDTDSLFIQLKTNSDEEKESLRKEIQERIAYYVKSTYKIDSKLRLDVEYTFDRVIILTKKRYYGFTTKGEPIIKGLEMVRKDTAKVTVVQEDYVSKMRLDGVPLRVIREHIEKLYDNIKKGRISLEEIAVMGRCSKDTYPRTTRNEKAMKLAKKYGIEINSGERFYWLYVYPKSWVDGVWDGVKKKYPANIIAFKEFSDIPKELIIDYQRMADYTIKNPLSKYIEVEKDIKNRSLMEYINK